MPVRIWYFYIFNGSKRIFFSPLATVNVSQEFMLHSKFCHQCAERVECLFRDDCMAVNSSAFESIGRFLSVYKSGQFG